jgi:hypothetical protein
LDKYSITLKRHTEKYTMKISTLAIFRLSTSMQIVGFEVLMAVSMKMAVFWVVALCSLVEVYQHFRGPDDGGSNPKDSHLLCR